MKELQASNRDIMMISETWLKPNIDKLKIYKVLFYTQ